MRRTYFTLLLSLLVLPGQAAEVRTHLFSHAGPLTEASSLAPRRVADDFLQRVAPAQGLSADDLAGVYVAKEYRTRHNGVTHIVYRQQFQGVEVYDAEWVVNVDRDGRVINAGGTLYPAPGLGVSAPNIVSAPAAARAAAWAVNPRLGERYVPQWKGWDRAGRKMLFEAGDFGSELEGEPVWYGVQGSLAPAWLFYILDEDGIHNYATVVDESGQRILAKQNLTWFQSGPRGLVFERGSPQPNPNPGVRLTAPPDLVPRTLQPFAGDPVASPAGWVSGSETAGNNVVVGENLLGASFLSTPRRTSAPDGNFSFPLQTGPGAPNPLQFGDAANVNLFYWINQGHDLFYLLGFDEAAGNFQQDNFGNGGVAGDHLFVYSHYGTAGNSSASINNSFFSMRSRNDGAQSMIASFISVPSRRDFISDGAYEAVVILHEYTHGVSNRLVLLSGFQGGAMGEAWSDFFGLDFLTPDGAPLDGVYPMGEYWWQEFGYGNRSHPYSTNTDINPLTYADLGHVRYYPEVHADGEIWVEALWEMRAALIQQHGESEGRWRTRLLVIDAMKLSPPDPSMVDMRDAILLADRVDFDGASQEQIWGAFARRGLGVLAQSAGSNTAHAVPSFDLPSAVALRFYEDSYVIGETVRVLLYDPNLNQPAVQVQATATSGDMENLTLRRTGSVFLGSVSTSLSAAVTRGDGRLQLTPGNSITASYRIPGTFLSTVTSTVATFPSYAVTTAPAAFQFGDETRLSIRSSPGAVIAPIALPFDFPFFGEKHSAVWVHPNGLLTFDGIDWYSGCNDTYTFRTMKAIAPMWMDLRTSGSAQPNEDVYQSRGPDSVTFRWAGETLTSSTTVPGEPVNFSATLYQDGRIEFRYGSGNNNLSVSSSCAAYPTVGISNGHEMFSQTVSTHSGRTKLENAARVLFDPPFNSSSTPVGKLDSPAPQDRLQGVMIGKGVAYDPAARVSRVDVFVDGTAVTAATTGQSRTDFCAEQNVPGCPYVGFRFTLSFDALQLAAGRHFLQLRVTNTRGAYTDFPQTPLAFYADPGGQGNLPIGKIETPADGATVSGSSVRVQGYAAATDLRISAVDVLVDGITIGRPAYGDTRDAVCATLPGPPVNCPRIGFTFTLNTTTGSIPLLNGAHALTMRVLDETGRYTTLPSPPVNIVVNNPANQPPLGQLTTPKPNDTLSGTVKISGYAYDPDGRVTTVYLLIDGLTYTSIPYGKPRPDECAQLSGVAACPNIGFEMDFDTRRLMNGAHVLGIRLYDDRGTSIVIPSVVRNGMNVFVQN